MAKGYSKELVGVRDGTVVPANKANSSYYRARVRTIRAVFDLSQSNVARNSGDTNVIGVIPRGNRFKSLTGATDTSLGSSTVAVGYGSTPAAIKAAATFTATETPTSFGLVAARSADVFTADTEIFFTVGAATLPSSGLLVFEMEYAGR